MAERVAAIERSTVSLNGQRCLPALGRFSTCAACAAVCPVGAIERGRPAKLNAELCQNCLACLPVCPSGALSADDAVPALLNCAARVEARSIELICQQHPQAEMGLAATHTAIRVRGCLAGLGASAYVALIALGVARVLVRTDACGQCAWAALQTRVEMQVEQARQLLGPGGQAVVLVTAGAAQAEAATERPVWEADNPPLSRRDVFRLASRRGQVMMARMVTDEAETRPKALGRERQRLWKGLDQLPAREQRASQPLPAGLGLATVSVSEACTACGACARLCPTGALRLDLQLGERPGYRLTFVPQACIGCGACHATCLPGAVTIDAQPTFEAVFVNREPVELRAGELVRCKRCQTWMAALPGARLCPTCAFRARNPFGTRPSLSELKARS
jgi:ferredoxin